MDRLAEVEGMSGNLRKSLSYIYQLKPLEIIYIIWEKGNTDIPETFDLKHKDEWTDSNRSCQYSSMYGFLTLLDIFKLPTFTYLHVILDYSTHHHAHSSHTWWWQKRYYTADSKDKICCQLPHRLPAKPVQAAWLCKQAQW